MQPFTLLTPRRAKAVRGRMSSGVRPSSRNGWLLPPCWPLENWHALAADRWQDLVALRNTSFALRPSWPRWRRADPRRFVLGTASVMAIAVLVYLHTGSWPVGVRPSSGALLAAVPASHLLKPPAPSWPEPAQAVGGTSAGSSPVERTPVPPHGRVFADVSTMDLMMPIAEPDLDITSAHSLWAQIGKSCGIDPLLLYSVALVESKALYPDGKVAPTPWLFRVNDHIVRGDRHDVQLAMAAATQFGSAVQDVGIMQVYYPMHRDAVRDPLTLLNPRTNITVAAKILRAGMLQTHDRVLGVGYYHSHTPTLARDYGTLVWSVYKRLKAIYRPAAGGEIVTG